MKRPILDGGLRAGLVPIAFAALFSFAANILYLALPLYTMQIYDRVLTSQSLETLGVLTLGAAFCFVISGVVEEIRSRVLVNFGIAFDRRVSFHVFAALFDHALKNPGSARGQALRDLDQLRQTITGAGIGALFDIPWTPIFLIVLYIIDPWVGILTFSGAVLLLGLAVLQDRVTRSALKSANDAALASYGYTEAGVRNAEIVRAMGMLPGLTRRWSRARITVIERQAIASSRAGIIGALIRGVRMLLQIFVVGIGAYLVLEGSIGPGVLFANMILSARALAPIERLVGSWNALVAARQAYDRLKDVMAGYQPAAPSTALPRPSGRLSVEALTYRIPGTAQPLLRNVSFALEPGEMLGIIGPSGAGKSTLLRLLVGIFPADFGSVRLDGMDVHAWERSEFGQYAGYLPQDVELFGGTVRDNIARFRTDVTDEAVVAAATSCGVHDMVMRLANGYDTEIRDGGAVLSGGMRQRVALARTLLGHPSLVVLDEPNASLDGDGEAALINTLAALKARGTTIVVVSHRPSVFRHADKMLLLRDGVVEHFGPRDQVLARLAPAPQAAAGVPATQPPRPPQSQPPAQSPAQTLPPAGDGRG